MYHFKGTLTVGQVNRFLINVNHNELPDNVGVEALAIRVKNTTSALMRPALMTGPYILYTSVREQSYRHDTALGKGDFTPHFDPNVKTNCSRWQSIPITSSADTSLKSRTFVVDIAAQIVFSPSATIYFELTIGKSKSDVRHLVREGRVVEATMPGFTVTMQDTSTLWSMPPIQRDHPGHHVLPASKTSAAPTVKLDENGKVYDHLVVLTHGIHSNLTSDMLYLKEMIEKTADKNGERVLCKGFAGNACNTERGVRWLAENVGEWLLAETGWTCEREKVFRSTNPYKKISFIAHSLGGLTQIYVLGYLHDKTHGRIFNVKEGGLRPMHCITLATPWLGISAENPAYVKLALDFGLVGKTGQDLGLTAKPLGEYQVHDPRTSGDPEHQLGTTAIVRSREPLLKVLSRPEAASHIAMRLFETRTVYANIENDGIVPLRTSSLFFLDWEEFSTQKAKVLKRLHARKMEDAERSRLNSASGEIGDSEKISDGKLGRDQSSAPAKRMSESQPRRSHASERDSSPDESSSDEVEVTKQLASPEDVTAAPQRRVPSADSPSPPHSTEPPAREPETETNRSEPNASSKPGHAHSGSISKLLSVAHAVNFAGMIRRASGGRIASRSSIKSEFEDKLENLALSDSDTETHAQSPTSPSTTKPKALISGPSDLIEAASHGHGRSGLLGLLKPSGSSTRKPSRAFTRSQTIPKSGEEEDGEEEDQKVHPEEPSRTSFFRSLESVLNPPMPELDYITDPAHREPRETVIVHDKFYYPEDIPPLKELPRRTSDKNQSHSEKKAEEKHHVQLEKVRLEEKIARNWHKDMVWRKVLVKLKPDAHNNIIVRRMYPNCFGWPVIDHLVEHHFGASAQKNAEMHESEINKSSNQEQRQRDGLRGTSEDVENVQ